MNTTQPDEVILKTDALGRVKTPAARREALLDEFERSEMNSQANHRTRGANENKHRRSFSVCEPLCEGKLNLLKLNIPAPCPPSRVFLVNQGRGLASVFHLSTTGSSSVRDATAPVMSLLKISPGTPYYNLFQHRTIFALARQGWFGFRQNIFAPRCFWGWHPFCKVSLVIASRVLVTDVHKK